MTADNLSKTVVSTRVRLARNLEGYPFPSHLKDEKQAKEIIRLVSSGLSRVDGFNSPDEFRLYKCISITWTRCPRRRRSR